MTPQVPTDCAPCTSPAPLLLHYPPGTPIIPLLPPQSPAGPPQVPTVSQLPPHGPPQDPHYPPITPPGPPHPPHVFIAPRYPPIAPRDPFITPPGPPLSSYHPAQDSRYLLITPQDAPRTPIIPQLPPPRFHCPPSPPRLPAEPHYSPPAPHSPPHSPIPPHTRPNPPPAPFNPPLLSPRSPPSPPAPQRTPPNAPRGAVEGGAGGVPLTPAARRPLSASLRRRRLPTAAGAARWRHHRATLRERTSPSHASPPVAIATAPQRTAGYIPPIAKRRSRDAGLAAMFINIAASPEASPEAEAARPEAEAARLAL